MARSSRTISSSQAKEGVAATFAVPRVPWGLFIVPMVVGQGTQLFPDIGRDRALELVESCATPSGVMN
jgi:hypothetical protein